VERERQQLEANKSESSVNSKSGHQCPLSLPRDAQAEHSLGSEVKKDNKDKEVQAGGEDWCVAIPWHGL
jgi:hypothetical protein